MSPEALFYEQLEAPQAALLERRVFKKLFLEHGTLTSADKTALSENVEQVLWKYSFTPATVAIGSYTDEDCEYMEVALLEVQVRHRKGTARLAELVHRTVQYPVLLLFVDAEGLAVSAALKRFSQAEKETLVVANFAIAPWSSLPPSDLDLQFFASFRFGALNGRDFFSLYRDLFSRVVARNCAEVTGRYQLSSGCPQKREESLKTVLQIQKEIERARSEIRRGASIARSVELNTQIQGWKRELASQLETL